MERNDIQNIPSFGVYVTTQVLRTLPSICRAISTHWQLVTGAWTDGPEKFNRSSISALGARRASFFDHSPPVRVFGPHLTKQFAVLSHRV